MRRFPPKRILAAADLSVPSQSALASAQELAELWGAALEIVYVQLPAIFSFPISPDAMPLIASPPAPETRRSVERQLRKAAEGFPPERLTLSTVRGWPPAALRALARPERADLLVMGTHEYAGLDRLLAGSVAEAVIRRARIPVLAVPEHTSISDVARVLAPWNGRPYATRALRWARELSRSLCATLDVLQVKESEGSIARDWRASDRRLTSILGAGPDWMLRTRAGDARKRIIAEANSGRYELVVLAAHRRPFAADFVLGSTVERLLRHCEVPILAVPSGPRRPRLIRRLASRASARLY